MEHLDYELVSMEEERLRRVEYLYFFQHDSSIEVSGTLYTDLIRGLDLFQCSFKAEVAAA